MVVAVATIAVGRRSSRGLRCMVVGGGCYLVGIDNDIVLVVIDRSTVGWWCAVVNGAWIHAMVQAVMTVGDSGSGGIAAVTVAIIVVAATAVVNSTVTIVSRAKIREILLLRRLQRVHLRVAIVLRNRRRDVIIHGRCQLWSVIETFVWRQWLR